MKTLIIKPIKSFPGYFADNYGTIYSNIIKKDKKPMRPHHVSNGYDCVSLRVACRQYKVTGVHRLVCEAFNGIPTKPNMTASHIDGNRRNNVPENLIWETYADNEKRKLQHGTDDRGCKNTRAKVTPQMLTEIRQLLASGQYKQTAIATMFSIHKNIVWCIKHNRRYRKDADF